MLEKTNYINEGLVKEYCKKLNYKDIYYCVAEDIIIALSNIISDDYIRTVLDNMLGNIVDDVITSSGVEDNGSYNDDDLKLAIGRALVNLIDKIK